MYKRRRFLIRKDIQFGLAMKFLATALCFALFIGFIVVATVWPVVSEFVPETLMDALTRQVCFRLVFFAIPAVFVIVALTVIFTHRIAGPLYRIERTLEDMISGEPAKPIHLRKRDGLQSLASKINALMPSCRSEENAAP